MILKKVATLIFVLCLMTMLFSNAVAYDIVHIAEYDLMGRVDLIQVTGSNHGSGAQRKLSISGDGQVEKMSHIVQQRGRLAVDDSQSWVTAVDALNNLKMISAVKLPALPQLVFTTTRYMPLDDNDGGSDETTSHDVPEKVTVARLAGVEVPVEGAIPVSDIIANDQFTGTIIWAPADEPFLPETVYTAMITLEPKGGYTFTGVAENFFTVAGAASVTNRADSGEVVALFPATEVRTYLIGDIGPSGVGIVFYITDGGRHGLEAAPSGWSGGEDPTKQWKDKISATGGTLTAIGTGYANTYSQMTGAEHPAAAICRDYHSEFEGDWFLPSKDELHQMYLHKKIIGGFANRFYWSSSELNCANGWSQSFRTGYQDSSSSKIHGYTYRVRPIRAF